MAKDDVKNLKKEIKKGKTKHAALNDSEKRKKRKTSFGPVVPSKGGK